ncbi:MAG: hypothetical protein HYY93_12365, partial [Planctomycetes bacterium]|nr:hypothetical protein [Planctomycetota bacterium]
MNPTCPKCGGPVEPGKDCPRCLLQVAMGESALTPSPGGTARPGLPVPSAGMGDTVKSPPPSSVPFAVPIDSEAVPPIPLGAPSAAVTPTVKSPTPGRTGSERPAPPSHGATHDAAPP